MLVDYLFDLCLFIYHKFLFDIFYIYTVYLPSKIKKRLFSIFKHNGLVYKKNTFLNIYFYDIFVVTLYNNIKRDKSI